MRINNRLAALAIDAALLLALLMATGALLGSTTPGVRFVGLAVGLLAFAQILRVAVRAAPILTATLPQRA